MAKGGAKNGRAKGARGDQVQRAGRRVAEAARAAMVKTRETTSVAYEAEAAMAGENELMEAWDRVRLLLRTELGEATFASWVKPLAFVGVDGDAAIHSVGSRFLADSIRSRFADRLLLHWRAVTPSIARVEVLVTSEPRRGPVKGGGGELAAREPHAAAEGEAAVGAKGAAPKAATPPARAAEAGVGAPLDPRFTFDEFVVGKSNELAYAAAARVAEETRVSFNPFYLYGGPGLGKTHLMHAVAWEIQARNPERRVIYMSAEKFMYKFVSALRYKETLAFKEQFRSVDVLMIDDLQFLAHKESTQEEFFHTFNALVDHHRQVVVSADRPPVDLDGVEERIISRLGSGLAADIHPTDYELRLGILHAKAERAARERPGVTAPTEVLEFLAHRIASNVRELEGALNRVIAYAEFSGREINLDFAQDVLSDTLRSHDRRVTIEGIQRKVAEHYNIRLADMLSDRRVRVIARPRQIAMYLAKRLTTKSLPEIGRKFGGRDHTTVIHAVRKIEELRGRDSQLNDDIEMLQRALE